MRILTGTSGFAYKEWKGGFYPADLPRTAMLQFYAGRFAAVEINHTFYRMPSETVLRQWADEVPHGFLFALKASQQITHRKRLRDVDGAVRHFFGVARSLEDHLGPVLFQLPPNMKKDVQRLDEFLGLIPPGIRAAFEFRNDSWFDEQVFESLRSRGAALCIAHGEGHDAPLVATADWGYLRLRQVDYDETAIADWARRIREQEWSEAYVFFKHEDTGTGPTLARGLAELFLEAST
ncbi:MAG: DUF72 domain-containing protein [Gemmatimonadota bacterium]